MESRTRSRKVSNGRRTAPQRQRTFVERNRAGILIGLVAVIVIAAGTIFALKFGPSSAGKEAVAGAQPADPAVVAALADIPQNVYDTVGLGSAVSGLKATNAPAITQDGKPEFLYIGAEYCPFCAAERWAMIAALSRFGSFSNLHTTQSAAADVYPNTPTFTFVGSTYSSQYLSLSTVEQYTNQPASGGGYTTLQDLSGQAKSIFDQFNRPPYVSQAGGIPFIDIGGKYVLNGATFDPGLLSKLDWSQIADLLKDPTSKQSQAIAGSANLITAAICQTTGGQPAAVCQSAGVQSAAAALGGK